MEPKLPDSMIIGMVENEWPLQAFASDGVHARYWVEQDPTKRHLWLITWGSAQKLRYVPPGEGRLEPDSGAS